MSKKDNVIKSMISMMDMGVIEGENSDWYKEAKDALEEKEVNVWLVVNRLIESLKSAIDSTDDYDMFDRLNGKQYFKHEIFKDEIELLSSLVPAAPTDTEGK